MDQPSDVLVFSTLCRGHDEISFEMSSFLKSMIFIRQSGIFGCWQWKQEDRLTYTIDRLKALPAIRRGRPAVGYEGLTACTFPSLFPEELNDRS